MCRCCGCRLEKPNKEMGKEDGEDGDVGPIVRTAMVVNLPITRWALAPQWLACGRWLCDWCYRLRLWRRASVRRAT